MGLCFLAAAGNASAEMVIINGVPYDSKKQDKGNTNVLSAPVSSGQQPPVVTAPPPANASSDDALRIKRVFLFPSLDDLNGVLAPQLDAKLSELFARQSRFELIRDPQVLRALAPDDANYGKAATSPVVHKEASRVTGADTTALLHTKNVGNDVEMTLELRDAQGDLLFSESGAVPGYSAMAARNNLIEKLFRSIVAKIPFDGTVTGRTANTLTLDLGYGSVRAGDDLDLARIVSVQRHPLLHTIIGTDYVKVGRARVTSVDKSLSFAEVSEEYSRETIRPGVKVLLPKANAIHRGDVGQLPERPNGRPAQSAGPLEKDPFEDRLKGEFDRRKPRFGIVGVNLNYGSLTHSESSNGNLTEVSGGGFGGDLDAEIWVTREWIGSVSYGFHGANLAGTGISAGSASWKKFEAAAGYRIFPEAIAEGAQLTGSVGYQTQKFKVPTVSGTTLGGKAYNGIVLKLDGAVNFLPDQKITAGFAFQPFSSFSDDGVSTLGSPDGGNVVTFQMAWNYRFADQFWAKVGMRFDTANGNYSNSASVSDKRFAIGPGIYYSF